MAIARDYEFLCDGLTVNAYIQQVHEQTRPWGDSGGSDGAAGAIIANPGRDDETPLSSKAIGLNPAVGSRVRLQSAGGGGLGQSAARDQASDR